MLRLDMAHLSVPTDKPGFDTVEVIETVWPGTESSNGDQLLSRRLHVTSFIRAARLQRRFAALPPPRQRKAGRRFREHRSVEAGIRPGVAAVRRDFDPRDATAAGPRQTGDLIRAAAVQDLFARRARDDRFRFHDKREPARVAIRHEIGVAGSFVACHEWLVCHQHSIDPFDIYVTFPTGNDQPQGITLLGPERLTVLTICDQY